MESTMETGRGSLRKTTGDPARSAARGTRPTSRRTYTARTRRKRGATPSWSMKERLLLQSIVCGVFLAAALFINLLNTSFSTATTTWLSDTIAHNATVDMSLAGIYDTVTGLFDGGVKQETQDGAEDADTEGDNAAEPTEARVPTVNDTRVDDGVLAELTTAEDTYGEKK